MEKEKAAFTEHLEELRSRLLKSLLAIAAASIAAYGFVDPVLRHIAKPVGKFIFIMPHEAFFCRLKIALFGGVFLSLPYILYQAWRFIKSGLKDNEKRYALIFGPLSFLFCMAGAGFGYFIIVPIGVKFLLGFANAFMVPMISMNSYISFLGVLMLAFGVLFEIPLAALLLTKIGIITPHFLTSKRREAIVLIFIVAAILTPPDAITQCLLAVPLLALYEISIIFSKLVYRERCRDSVSIPNP